MPETPCAPQDDSPAVAHSHHDGSRDFVLLTDPGPYPLASGLELPRLQVVYGLRYGSFSPGTVLLDQASGLRHTVCRKGSHWVLDPPSPRIRRVCVENSK